MIELCMAAIMHLVGNREQASLCVNDTNFVDMVKQYVINHLDELSTGVRGLIFLATCKIFAALLYAQETKEKLLSRATGSLEFLHSFISNMRVEWSSLLTEQQIADMHLHAMKVLRILTDDKRGVELVNEVSAQLATHVSRMIGQYSLESKFAIEARALIKNLTGVDGRLAVTQSSPGFADYNNTFDSRASS